MSETFLEYHRQERERSANESYLLEFLAPLEIAEGAAFLDLGCGSGYLNQFLASRESLSRNLGFDLDPAILRVARESSQTRARVSWVRASAEAVPLPDACVDHVVCRGVVPLARVEAVVSEIARILRPGGTALLLLHKWTFYTRWLSRGPRSWKQRVSGVVILLLGAWFHVTGQQLQPSFRGHRITQTFQTTSRMRKLLERFGMRAYRVREEPEFLVYARKAEGG